MHWDFAALTPAERYKLLVALVIPRPIAFVSTRSRDGADNAAPFSFFNVMGEDPPIVVLSHDRRPDGSRKDTPRNILDTREFVVNLVDEALLERMHAASTAFPPEVSEFDAVGLTRVPSRRIAPPRIGESPASIECRLHTHLGFGGRDLFVGEGIALHVRDGLVDPQTLRVAADYAPVGRLYANMYAFTRDRVKLEANAYVQEMQRRGRAD
jgi:flavin reductase (DIM6/NTAB) family NADH-FMN oxidoreductase RutF